MNRVIASLKDKRFRYGSFSTAMMLFVVVLFLLANLVVGQFNISKDLTSDQMYSLSKYTKEFVAGLDKPVTIYALFQTGQENKMYKQLLDEYAASSPNISVVYKDPVLYPAFVEAYAKTDEQIANNSVIVECGTKFKVVQATDMVTYDYDYNTWEQYVKSIDIEPQISNAINYVTSGDTAVVYQVKGNNEFGLPANLAKQIEMANYELRDVDLVTGDIPEDCALLMITTPARDWSTDEADRILKYLQNDGKAVFALGLMQERFPNLDNVLAAFGVRVGDYIVLEGDANYYYMNNPGLILAHFAASDITQTFIDKKYASLLYQTTGIETLSLKKAGTKIEPLMVTSASAYGKTDPNSTTVNKEPNDLDGPFNLAVTVTDTYYTDAAHTTKLVVLGCDYLMEESTNGIVSGTNWEFIVNSVNWLQGQDTSIYIPSKSPSSTTQLTISQAQAGMMALVAIIVIPLVFVATGLVVWLRRRHN